MNFGSFISVGFLLQILSYINSNGKYLKELLEIFYPCFLQFFIIALLLTSSSLPTYVTRNIKSTVTLIWRLQFTVAVPNITAAMQRDAGMVYKGLK